MRTDQRELREEEYFFFCSKLEVFLKLLLSFRSFLTSGSFLPYERIKSVFSKKKIERKPPTLFFICVRVRGERAKESGARLIKLF